ncbi:MAG TPA: Rad52/Rad22 family DNA repair protein, partial [Terriglobales bacterium]|nr:Rad52/Rad22 family DNA repair protein [Terriglobales bacterium]
YADRLNALFTAQGWTRKYQIETMSNITRMKKGESISSGKILVTCTVTIVGLWSHSGTGEEWADDENGMTSADAQAFKRACSCFGLGRYFYEFQGSWVDLDQNQQPKRIPALPAWAIPENWRQGIRPPGRNGNCNGGHVNGGNGNGHRDSKPNGGQTGASANSGVAELDTRIVSLEKAVGPNLYGSVLREYGKATHPRLIMDVPTKRRVLEILLSAERGINRLSAVRKRIDPKVLETLLAKIQAPPLAEIADMKTLRDVVFGLEQLADSPPARTV